jgi:anti-sigma factor (TIGR02949 family)
MENPPATQPSQPYPGDEGHRVMCQEVVDLLGEFVDGSLPADLAHDVQAHLDACPECLRFLDQMRLMMRHVGHLPDPSNLSADVQALLVERFRDVARGDPT